MGNNPNLKYVVIPLVFAAAVSGCAGGGSGSDDPENSLPSVSAGSDQTVNENTTVSLLGSATDSDGTVVSYLWEQTSGISVSLIDADGEGASFTAPEVDSDETLTFSFTATDDDGGFASDSVNITVSPVTVTTRALNDTGITLCSDYAYDTGSGTHNNDVDCALTAETANGLDPVPAGQDSHYGRDADSSTNSADDGNAGFSFTKLDETSGGDLAANATDWGCVRDNVTGLIWEVKTEDDSLRDKDWEYTWYNSTGVNDGGFEGYGDTGTLTTTDASEEGTDTCYDSARCDTEKFVADVNTSELCGYSDWRLPTREELSLIVDYSTVSPAIDTVYFPNTQSSVYWSSSPNAYYSSGAWVLGFSDGYGYSLSKSDGYYVRLVRGQ